MIKKKSLYILLYIFSVVSDLWELSQFETGVFAPGRKQTFSSFSAKWSIFQPRTQSAKVRETEI